MFLGKLAVNAIQQEFGVNDEAVPIILHLIDQLNRIRLEVKDRLF